VPRYPSGHPMTRRAGVVGAALAVAAVVSGLAAGGPTAKAKLRVVTLRPFVVAGSGFHAGETVRVTVRADTAYAWKRDEASTAGRIGVRFPALRLGECPEYVVAARGDMGSRAGLRSIPRLCGIDPGRAP
jgi:hypothetical protein